MPRSRQSNLVLRRNRRASTRERVWPHVRHASSLTLAAATTRHRQPSEASSMRGGDPTASMHFHYLSLCARNCASGDQPSELIPGCLASVSLTILRAKVDRTKADWDQSRADSRRVRQRRHGVDWAARQASKFEYGGSFFARPLGHVRTILYTRRVSRVRELGLSSTFMSRPAVASTLRRLPQHRIWRNTSRSKRGRSALRGNPFTRHEATFASPVANTRSFPGTTTPLPLAIEATHARQIRRARGLDLRVRVLCVRELQQGRSSGEAGSTE